MKTMLSIKHALIISLWAFIGSSELHAKVSSNVLVTIDDKEITSQDLNQAVSSSPFYTQFNTMSQDEQASLRGDILRRLVASELLRIEAQRQKLNEAEDFQKELETFEIGLLYKHYMDHLRDKIQIPEEKLQQLKRDFKSQPDALEAAKSSFKSNQYQKLHNLTIQQLRDTYHIKIHENLIAKTTPTNAILFEGDHGISISYGDILKNTESPSSLTKDQILDRLFRRGELLVVAQAARDAQLDISTAMTKYEDERLPALLMEKKEKEWIPNENVLKDYFDAHPKLGIVPERWHIGQIVLKTKPEAERVLARIKNGESLFTLAEKMSIDPYGKSKSGDMGWVKQGTGHPAIQQVLNELNDRETSKIAKTPKGYHILTIIDRRPGSKQRFNGFQDKIRQIVVAEKLRNYIKTLQDKHDINWLVVQNSGSNTKPTSEK
jgi:peptidyl-prolyl cis-trans isomerase C